MSRDPINSRDDISTNTMQAANEGLSDVKDRVADMTSKMRDKAGQVAETVSEKVGQQRENAAATLGRAASVLHERANDVPGGPKVVDLAHNIADGMQSTASYLRSHDFSQMGKDVFGVCRRHPTQSLVAALAIGFFLGRSRR